MKESGYFNTGVALLKYLLFKLLPIWSSVLFIQLYVVYFIFEDLFATILDFFNIRGGTHGTMIALLATNNGLYLMTRAFYGSPSNKFLKPRGRCIN